jgi:hypothetical protein
LPSRQACCLAKFQQASTGKNAVAYLSFSGPVTPAFLAEIARHRKTEFGTFSINAFEIVRTDKFLSNTGTETIARIVVEHG